MVYYEGWFVILSLVVGMLLAYSLSADASLMRQLRKTAKHYGGRYPVTLEITKRGKYSCTYVLDSQDLKGHKTFTETNKAARFLFHFNKAQKQRTPEEVWR